MNATPVEYTLRSAGNLLQQGRVIEAEQLYLEVLRVTPKNPEAMAAVGQLALKRGHHERAAEMFASVLTLDADNPLWLEGLGLANLALSRLDQAADALGRVARLAPKRFVARLHYARVLELLGREYDALTNYFSAITQAQLQGSWMSDASTAPGLRDLVKHAMRYAARGRKRLLEGILAPLYKRHGASEMARVTESLKVYLGELQARNLHPKQQPTFLHFPSLPPITYYARDFFPWYRLLESNFADIRQELLAVIDAKVGIEPFLEFNSAADVSHLLGGIDTPVWDAYFFYRHGQRYSEQCHHCPLTSQVLDKLPLVSIRDHAPEVCFSFLTPGTHILPHRGVTNTRLVTHLPLIVPENCALNVGGEVRQWSEGECFTFDDTFEHEAWNRGETIRVVMLMDVWNPLLTAPEREALTLLVEGIGDFRHDCDQDHRK